MSLLEAALALLLPWWLFLTIMHVIQRDVSRSNNKSSINKQWASELVSHLFEQDLDDMPSAGRPPINRRRNWFARLQRFIFRKE